jgi:hypothetical protein
MISKPLRQNRLKTLATRSLLFALGGTLGLVGSSLLIKAFAADSAADSEATANQEPSPEEIQAEMTDDLDSIYTTGGQHLSPSQMNRIQRVRETNQLLKGLGLHDAVRPAQTGAEEASYRVEVDVFKRPSNLDGMTLEFMTVKVDGVVQNAYIISTAKPGKHTIEGSFPANIERRRGRTNPEYKPYPWRRSRKYNNSPMFWGLHLSGGYWTHSTTHYGELGRPASMGCVRMTFPSAMELWDLVVNDVGGSAIVRIHGSGSASASEAFRNLGVNAGWINQRIQADLADAHAISTHEYTGVGHPRMGRILEFPSCEGVDCFNYFGVRKPVELQ